MAAVRTVVISVFCLGVLIWPVLRRIVEGVLTCWIELGGDLPWSKTIFGSCVSYCWNYE